MKLDIGIPKSDLRRLYEGADPGSLNEVLVILSGLYVDLRERIENRLTRGGGKAKDIKALVDCFSTTHALLAKFLKLHDLPFLAPCIAATEIRRSDIYRIRWSRRAWERYGIVVASLDAPKLRRFLDLMADKYAQLLAERLLRTDRMGAAA